MNIESKVLRVHAIVEVVAYDLNDNLEVEINSQAQAQTMIAQFQDVMEDFFRVWPELREASENGLI